MFNIMPSPQRQRVEIIIYLYINFCDYLLILVVYNTFQILFVSFYITLLLKYVRKSCGCCFVSVVFGRHLVQQNRTF